MILDFHVLAGLTSVWAYLEISFLFYEIEETLM